MKTGDIGFFTDGDKIKSAPIKRIGFGTIVLSLSENRDIHIDTDLVFRSEKELIRVMGLKKQEEKDKMIKENRWIKELYKEWSFDYELGDYKEHKYKRDAMRELIKEILDVEVNDEIIHD